MVNIRRIGTVIGMVLIIGGVLACCIYLTTLLGII